MGKEKKYIVCPVEELEKSSGEIDGYGSVTFMAFKCSYSFVKYDKKEEAEKFLAPIYIFTRSFKD